MIIMANSGGYKPLHDLRVRHRGVQLDQPSVLHRRLGYQAVGVSRRVTPTNMPTPTRHGAFVNVSAAIAENMHKWNTSTPDHAARC